MKIKLVLYFSLLILSTTNVFAQTPANNEGDKMKEKEEVSTLGGGCFWCVEAVFDSIKGVNEVISGYTGGKNPNPTYEEVSSGSSGHAEVVQVKFNPELISYAEILNIFFHTHDPTTLNQQGADRGTQYRSVIYYHDEKQKEIATKVIAKITENKLWSKPIVTEISPLQNFYPAEDYHQNYYKNNSAKPYCSLVIGPKIQKLKKEFADRMK